MFLNKEINYDGYTTKGWKIMCMVIHKQNDCRQNHANLEFCEVCLQALSKNLSISKIKAIHKKGKQIDL